MKGNVVIGISQYSIIDLHIKNICNTDQLSICGYNNNLRDNEYVQLKDK